MILNILQSIGKDIKQNEYGGVEPIGIKVSLFDVSDVTHPVTVDTYSIGGQGTDSEGAARSRGSAPGQAPTGAALASSSA